MRKNNKSYNDYYNIKKKIMEGIILLLKVSENLKNMFEGYVLDKIKLEINSKINEYFVILSSVIKKWIKKKKIHLIVLQIFLIIILKLIILL